MNQTEPIEEKKASINGLAIGSLVASLLGIALVGLILGIIALMQIRSSGGRMRGKGMAIAGIIICCLYFAIVPVVAYSAFSNARERSRRTASAEYMRALYSVLIMASEDSPTRDFPTDPYTLYPSYLSDSGVFRNPRNPPSIPGYVYVSGLNRKNTQCILIYENEPIDAGGRNVLTAGGSVTFFNETDFQTMLERSKKSAREAGRYPAEILVDQTKFSKTSR